MKSKKVNELFEAYQRLKVLPLIIYRSGAGFFFWATLAMVAPSYGFLFAYIATGNMGYLAFSFGFIIPGMIFHILSVSKCNKYLRTDPDFASYRSDMKLRWWSYNYESFIYEYKFHKIKSKLGHIGMNSHIDDVVNVLETDGTKLMDGNWRPVVILGAVLFPLIGEYVGFRFNLILQNQSTVLGKLNEQMVTSPTPNQVLESNKLIEHIKMEGLVLIINLLALMIFTSITIWLLVILSDKLLLSKVRDRKKLIRLLLLIKIGS